MALRTASSEMGCGKVCWGLVGLRRGALSGLLLAGSLDGKLSLETIFKSWISQWLGVIATHQALDAFFKCQHNFYFILVTIETYLNNAITDGCVAPLTMLLTIVIMYHKILSF